ncbi:ATP-NAD kinase [archaeon]|nr:MAG: ATP-NAD kinase [archaeon]HDM23713.1 ATP-NAD kinase [Candidatus Bathyarchaeota archaeon]
MQTSFKVGLIVNPIAGMGGSVGLKGTDGEEILREAIKRGAKPVAPKRTLRFLRRLKTLLESENLKLQLYTYPHPMGEKEAIKAGFKPIVIGKLSSEKTTAEDTVRAAREMEKIGVEIIAFAGGDGTACDIYEAIKDRTPIIGIPTGVKMHSGVFASSPEAAADLLVKYLKGGAPLGTVEVMDLDEDLFRKGILAAKLKGYLKSPIDRFLLQSSKSYSQPTHDEELNKMGIAREVIEQMEKNTLYIVGPGTTTKAIADMLKINKTLLGVDVVLNGKLIAKDVDESKLLELLGKFDKAKIIVTPIGSQGFIFGRGNQQISAKVIRKVGRDNIIVIATRGKLAKTPFLRVDTGDPELDEKLKGYWKVVTDYGEYTVVKCI